MNRGFLWVVFGMLLLIWVLPAVYAVDYDSLTVKNCRIVQGHPGLNDTRGIYLENSDNDLIENNTIEIAYDTSRRVTGCYGIYLIDADRAKIDDNDIFSEGYGDNYAIRYDGGVSSNITNWNH